jgi:membrane protease YdiL (CAAX protease family)
MSANILLILTGLVSFLLGIYTTRIKLKIFRQGKQDRYGIDFQLLVLGVLMIVLGMALIGHFI